MQRIILVILIGIAVCGLGGNFARADVLNMYGDPAGPNNGPVELILNGTITLQAVSTGFYETNSDGTGGAHCACNSSYFVGTGPEEGFIHNDFFVFSLANVSVPVSTAILSFYVYGYSGASPAVYSTWDVTTSIPDLETTQTGAANIVADLGSGTSYGSTLVGNYLVGSQANTNLDADAITALNAARGADFAIGGTLSAVPEPSTWAMLLIGFAGMGFAANWRRGRKTFCGALASTANQGHVITPQTPTAVM